MNRTEAANAVLALVAPKTSVEVRGPYAYVTYWRYRFGRAETRRWLTRGGSFYPVWSRKFTHGGTVTTALAQLVRWCLNKPVLPLSTWEYWTSPTVGLGLCHGADRGPEVLALLQAAGYPGRADCVLCGKELRRFDWWHLDGVSGPCCYRPEDCSERRRP